MNHKGIDELLSAYANEELSRTQRKFVEQHLSSCDDCRSTLAGYTWVRSRLASLRTTPIEANIKEATMLKIDAL